VGNVLTPYVGYAAENAMIATTMMTTTGTACEPARPMPATTLIEAARRLLGERTPAPTVDELTTMLMDGYPDLCRRKTLEAIRHTAQTACVCNGAGEAGKKTSSTPPTAPEAVPLVELARRLVAESQTRPTVLELTARLKEVYPDVCARRSANAVYTAAWNALKMPAPTVRKPSPDKLSLAEVARRCLDLMGGRRPTTSEVVAQMRKRYPADVKGRRLRTLSNTARTVIRTRYGDQDGTSAAPANPVVVPAGSVGAEAGGTVADLLALKALLVRLGGEPGLRVALESLRQLGVL